MTIFVSFERGEIPPWGQARQSPQPANAGICV